MDRISAWIESKINECRPQREIADDPNLIERLLSTCAALKNKEGALFGMAYPQSGVEPSLYPTACAVLQLRLDRIKDDQLRAVLIEAILRNALDVEVPAEQRQAYEKKHTSEIDLAGAEVRQDRIGEIARVAKRLKNAGIDISGYQVSEIPSDATFERVCAGLPQPLPDPLRVFLATMPAQMYLEWSHHDVSGFASYELSRLEAVQRHCHAQVVEWLSGLEHYYRIWSESTPFMETADGAGYIAFHKDGSVRYLDDNGNTDINGKYLGSSLNDFWESWCDLAFASIQPHSLTDMSNDHGLDAASPFARQVKQVIGGDPLKRA